MQLWCATYVYRSKSAGLRHEYVQSEVSWNIVTVSRGWMACGKAWPSMPLLGLGMDSFPADRPRRSHTTMLQSDDCRSLHVSQHIYCCNIKSAPSDNGWNGNTKSCIPTVNIMSELSSLTSRARRLRQESFDWSFDLDILLVRLIKSKAQYLFVGRILHYIIREKAQQPVSNYFRLVSYRGRVSNSYRGLLFI